MERYIGLMAKNLSPSGTPLYVRLKEVLREMCLSLGPDAKLPSESEIERRYEVSRTTVRLAVGALVNEGLIIAKQGKGSFVASPKRAVVFQPGLLQSSTVEPLDFLSFENVPAGQISAKLLNITSDDLVYKIRRVLRMGDTPLCYQVSYIPAHFIPDLTIENIQKYASKYASSAAAAEQSIEIVLADAYRADNLQVVENSPLLLCEQVVRLGDDPIELVRSFYGGHSFKINF